MHASEARVPTRRADRYLAQLCDHLGHLQQDQPSGHRGGGHGHGGPAVVHGVDRAEGQARIEFDWGGCVLTATPRELVVEVRAESAAELARGQELLERRIVTIGRREELEVAWTPLDGD
jgi:hypothetical protein